MADDLFKKWLEPVSPKVAGISIFGEQKGARAKGLELIKELIVDHFVGEATVLAAGGYAKAAAIIQNSLPTNKRTRSGDLGELLGTEYVSSQTKFVVPLKKLRWKSDRQMPLHGNDIIAIDSTATPVRLLKGECKSRASFGKAVAEEAAASLDLHDGRPNPSTLAFITKRLYEEKRDAEAAVFRDLQTASSIPAKSITHMIFALAGDDPSPHLAAAPKAKRGIARQSAGIIVSDHQAFVAQAFS